MGKIGDLLVRLGLKWDDFKKGLKDAKKEIQGFGKTLSNMKAGALAVWAAIGASVIKVGQDFLSATNRMGDSWEMFTKKASAGWRSFLQSLSNKEFDGMIAKMKDAVKAASVLKAATDYSFEVSNSIKLQRASIANELAELLIKARDPNVGLQEQLAATKRYMALLKPIYQQEIDMTNELAEARFGMWFAGTGIENNATSRADLSRFLVDYGKDKNLAAMSAEYLAALMNKRNTPETYMAYDAVSGEFKKMANTAKLAEAQAVVNRAAAKLQEYGQNNGYTLFVGKLAELYENWRGDADTAPLVEALVNASNAQAALNQETRKVQNMQNQINAQITQGAFAEIDKQIQSTVSRKGAQADKGLDKFLTDLDTAVDKLIEMEDIKVLNGFDAAIIEADAQLKQFVNDYAKEMAKVAELNQMFEDSIISAVSGGLQALSDLAFGLDGASWENVLAAFVQPLADTMRQMGEMFMAEGIAMTAFKNSIKNPAALIAAGAALIAVSSVVTSGLNKLVGNPAGATSASTGAGSTSAGGIDTYEQEITVHVVGEISGNNIVLAGQKTLNKWNR
jgi:hypothetical protein